MAGLKTVIYTNGVVQSFYDNGTPADQFSGKLPILYNIFKHIDNKLLIAKEYKLTTVKFYIADDILCTNKMEVTESYLKHILQYFREELVNIPINESKDIDFNEIITKAEINANTNFDNEQHEPK